MPSICTGHLHLVFSCSGLQKVSQSHNSTNVKIDGVEKMGEQVFDLTSHIAENFELNLHGALSQVVGSKREHKLFPNGKDTQERSERKDHTSKKLFFFHTSHKPSAGNVENGGGSPEGFPTYSRFRSFHKRFFQSFFDFLFGRMFFVFLPRKQGFCTL